MDLKTVVYHADDVLDDFRYEVMHRRATQIRRRCSTARKVGHAGKRPTRRLERRGGPSPHSVVAGLVLLEEEEQEGAHPATTVVAVPPGPRNPRRRRPATQLPFVPSPLLVSFDLAAMDLGSSRLPNYFTLYGSNNFVWYRIAPP